ncbi:uncharacterized protein ASCRUDRAFT_70106 [Ascoidea rubescens DSM 1968]|uniref:Uncharacterized protein n=1 Tax=Ascoidea rubescens DSM 1968 TaxID=1344418 RepID=A0A1D2VJ99_9ASCO|nr:hypothetical protein ASCRUDRAFT_70106 [Ascoidea rubescens DSM 1968]ODV61633.1 hypothetical protein ASCRUDRAFT_70106 [Ascoidea rubescens DSM 1968]
MSDVQTQLSKNNQIKNKIKSSFASWLAAAAAAGQLIKKGYKKSTHYTAVGAKKLYKPIDAVVPSKQTLKSSKDFLFNKYPSLYDGYRRVPNSKVIREGIVSWFKRYKDVCLDYIKKFLSGPMGFIKIIFSLIVAEMADNKDLIKKLSAKVPKQVKD